MIVVYNSLNSSRNANCECLDNRDRACADRERSRDQFIIETERIVDDRRTLLKKEKKTREQLHTRDQPQSTHINTEAASDSMEEATPWKGRQQNAQGERTLVMELRVGVNLFTPINNE